MSQLAAGARNRNNSSRRDPDFRSQVHGSATAAELASLQPEVVVDARGTFCPEPVIRTQNRMRDMQRGQILQLWADDAGVEIDIPAWCISTGNDFLGMIKEPRVYQLYVRKASP
ncbi:MAG: sulfurtransferase TusA family protein [Acidobacteriota bacterium]